MIFTREDILKIQNALLQLGRKDSEFKDANTPLSSDDEIAILQDGINKKVSINNLLSTLGLLKKDDFINVSDRYDEYYIQLSEAITIIANNKRKKGLVITFQDLQGNWKICQFNGELNKFIDTNYWKDLFDFKYPIINSILPDEEDLTLTYPDDSNNSFIKLKDKDYNPNAFSGKGHKILRKNIVNGKNILTQDMINESNTIYEIIYDFDLNDAEIKINNTSRLLFNGGTLRNGTINCVNIIGNGATLYCNVIVDGDGYRNEGGLITDLRIDCQYKYDTAFTTKNINYFVAENLRCSNFNYCGILVGSSTYEAMINTFECINSNENDIINCGVILNATDNHLFNGLIKHCYCGIKSGSANILNNIHIWGYTLLTKVGIIVGSACKINNVYFDGITIKDSSLDNMKLIDDSIDFSYNGGLGFIFTSSGNICNNITLFKKNVADTNGESIKEEPFYLMTTKGNGWGNVVNNIVVPDKFPLSHLILYRENNIFGKKGPYIKLYNINYSFGAANPNDYFSYNIQNEKWFTNGVLYAIEQLDSNNLEGLTKTVQLVSANKNNIFQKDTEENAIKYMLKGLNGSSLLNVLINQDKVVFDKYLSYVGAINNSILLSGQDLDTIVDGGYYHGNSKDNTNVPYDDGFFRLIVFPGINKYEKVQNLIIRTSKNVNQSIFRTLRITDDGSITPSEWVFGDGRMAFRQIGASKPYIPYLTEGTKFINNNNKVLHYLNNKWLEYDGCEENIRRFGTFSEKPTEEQNITKGFAYFCTDKQTSEGSTNGIMIYYKGNNVWVDALGRVVS